MGLDRRRRAGKIPIRTARWVVWGLFPPEEGKIPNEFSAAKSSGGFSLSEKEKPEELRGPCSSGDFSPRSDSRSRRSGAGLPTPSSRHERGRVSGAAGIPSGRIPTGCSAFVMIFAAAPVVVGKSQLVLSGGGLPQSICPSAPRLRDTPDVTSEGQRNHQEPLRASRRGLRGCVAHEDYVPCMGRHLSCMGLCMGSPTLLMGSGQVRDATPTPWGHPTPQPGSGAGAGRHPGRAGSFPPILAPS
jgi:hypothetical protein